MKEFADILTDELQPMWRFALRLASNEADAEDLVQRTCVKALESSHQYTEQGQLRSWLFRIEHRIWLNEIRARETRQSSHYNAGAQPACAYGEFNSTDPASNVVIIEEYSPESHLELHQIYLQVESLPEAQRLVVLLVCVEGFTYCESADILDIPIGTVMSRLARARMVLGKAMQHNGHRSVDVKGNVGLPR